MGNGECLKCRAGVKAAYPRVHSARFALIYGPPDDAMGGIAKNQRFRRRTRPISIGEIPRGPPLDRPPGGTWDVPRLAPNIALRLSRKRYAACF